MLPLLAGTGERLQSQAPPDPGHPYTSKTSRHVSALLESWAAWTQGCSLGNKMDDRLLPATPPEAEEPSLSPRLPELSRGCFANSAHTNTMGIFLCVMRHLPDHSQGKAVPFCCFHSGHLISASCISNSYEFDPFPMEIGMTKIPVIVKDNRI